MGGVNSLERTSCDIVSFSLAIMSLLAYRALTHYLSWLVSPGILLRMPTRCWYFYRCHTWIWIFFRRHIWFGFSSRRVYLIVNVYRWWGWAWLEFFIGSVLYCKVTVLSFYLHYIPLYRYSNWPNNVYWRQASIRWFFQSLALRQRALINLILPFSKT